MLGIETQDYGVVLAVPMGMAQVAAIELQEWVHEWFETGEVVQKGWEFANFAFGGSDFVVIFEPQADFMLTVPQMAEDPPRAGVNYEPSLQGEKYGCFGGDATCSEEVPEGPGQPDPYPGCPSSPR